jgi:hypothetical protein
MRKIIYICIGCAFVLVSCKKDRECECKNANGAYPAGNVEGTKYQAKKYCKSLSDGNTECYLK